MHKLATSLGKTADSNSMRQPRVSSVSLNKRQQRKRLLASISNINQHWPALHNVNNISDNKLATTLGDRWTIMVLWCECNGWGEMGHPSNLIITTGMTYLCPVMLSWFTSGYHSKVAFLTKWNFMTTIMNIHKESWLCRCFIPTPWNIPLPKWDEYTC